MNWMFYSLTEDGSSRPILSSQSSSCFLATKRDTLNSRNFNNNTVKHEFYGQPSPTGHNTFTHEKEPSFNMSSHINNMAVMAQVMSFHSILYTYRKTILLKWWKLSNIGFNLQIFPYILWKAFRSFKDTPKCIISECSRKPTAKSLISNHFQSDSTAT